MLATLLALKPATGPNRPNDRNDVPTANDGNNKATSFDSMNANSNNSDKPAFKSEIPHDDPSGPVNVTGSNGSYRIAFLTQFNN